MALTVHQKGVFFVVPGWLILGISILLRSRYEPSVIAGLTVITFFIIYGAYFAWKLPDDVDPSMPGFVEGGQIFVPYAYLRPWHRTSFSELPRNVQLRTSIILALIAAAVLILGVAVLMTGLNTSPQDNTVPVGIIVAGGSAYGLFVATREILRILSNRTS